MPPLSIGHRLLLVLLLSVAAVSGDTYDPSMCLNQTYRCGELNISYPFYLSEETRDLKGSSNSYCGYPGMGIVCYDDGKPVLEINIGESYTVTSIEDRTANLSFADPDVIQSSCPRVDHNVTFGPGAWLDFPSSTVNYLVFFLGCYFKPDFELPTIGPITCPGYDSGYPGQSFVFPDDSIPAGNWTKDCKQVIKAPVLEDELVDPNEIAWGNTSYAEVLRQGFQVSWDDNKPGQCAWCEESDGRCAYNEAGDFVGCLCGNGQIKNKTCGKYNSTPKHFQSATLYIVPNSKGHRFSSVSFSSYVLLACRLGSFSVKKNRDGRVSIYGSTE
jgi:hypothetical protein